MLELGTTYYEVTNSMYGMSIEKKVVVTPITHKGYVGGDIAGDWAVEPSNKTATVEIYDVETNELRRATELAGTIECGKVKELIESGKNRIEVNFGFIFLDKTEAVKYFNELLTARIQRLQNRYIAVA